MRKDSQQAKLFEILVACIRKGDDIGILDAVRKSDGKKVLLLCAIPRLEGRYKIMPVAEMGSGNMTKQFAPKALKDGSLAVLCSDGLIYEYGRE